MQRKKVARSGFAVYSMGLKKAYLRFIIILLHFLLWKFTQALDTCPKHLHTSQCLPPVLLLDLDSSPNIVLKAVVWKSDYS